MTLRKFIFWIHLTAGCSVGLVILIMSATGVLLAYERQINAWVDRSSVAAFSPGVRRLPLEVLLAKVIEMEHAAPGTLRFHAAATEPLEAAFDRGRTVFLNPFTGEGVGEASQRSRSFFEVVERWHRYLGAKGENRVAGRTMTAVSNVAFLCLVVTGPFLWWPRKWRWTRLRTILFFQGGLEGRARDWNWHNVAGIWSAFPLFAIVLSGVTMSYPNLLYRVTGSEFADPRPAPSARLRPDAKWDGLEALLKLAERQVPDWQTITMRLPNSSVAPVTFVIDRGDGGQPDKRSTLTLNRQTGEVVQWETFSNNNLGRRLRLWARYLHTGEQAGSIGQTAAGLASLGGTILACTGLMLAVRRFLRWRIRRGTIDTLPEMLSKEQVLKE